MLKASIKSIFRNFALKFKMAPLKSNMAAVSFDPSPIAFRVSYFYLIFINLLFCLLLFVVINSKCSKAHI